MRCPKCGKNVHSHHQEIDKTKTKITRYYGCRICHHKFCTVETIVEESGREA
jgi:transcriptional regulator NrdR family protein